MNTRLAVAIHILVFIHSRAGVPATSHGIASSVCTNPALIRRMLSQLAAAGLTTSKMGCDGGALLVRPAEDISLLDVYRAMNEAGSIFVMHDPTSPNCPIGRSINAALNPRLSAVEEEMHRQLARTTIADLVVDLSKLDHDGAK